MAQFIVSGAGGKLEAGYDLVIVGGGPAGLTAALYAARARVKHAILEKNPIPGGQIINTEAVENFPGFPEPVGGFELMERLRRQAEGFGANIVTAEVRRLSAAEGGFSVETNAGSTHARAVIIASGASPRRLGIDGEEKFLGKGVSFCATCDGPLYSGKRVVVIGGGDAGIEEGLFLTRFAEKVTVVEIMDRLGATKVLQERAAQNPKMEILLAHAPVAIIGTDRVEGVLVEDRKSGERKTLHADGVFIYVGIKPNTDFVSVSGVEFDSGGFIVTGGDMSTGVPGLFAAGDVRSKLLRQVSTAVGDGATAAFAAEKFLNQS